MSHTALIKFAPLVSAEALLDPGSVRAGRQLYDHGAFRLLRPDLPILVDHDDSRQVGIVREVAEIADTDGDWLAALATFTDPPGWVTRGTPVSFGYHTFRRQQIGDWSRINSGLLTEISVLSQTMKPADTRARVLTFGPADDAAARSSTAGDVVFYGGETLIRPNTGYVIGVR